MRAREAVTLVARRELSQRVREKSFLVGTGVSLAIIILVVVLPSLLGFGGQDRVHDHGAGLRRRRRSRRPPWPRPARSTPTSR